VIGFLWVIGCAALWGLVRMLLGLETLAPSD
jgi:hypothetical protein